ncbi:MAG: UDP-N-acetylglucosamine 1-carboxyvinyltransferase [Holosporaceae bacterium]|jgi:UDP-N-acetylglucosamine 1-carboxyvinyltransferase|nr:UDP-N-acetylglucosamine 1-carboxyvinyltransferase [Holosporaceae bacterium]
MVKIKVYGNQKIDGIVPISGAKNSALPLLAAAILSSNSLKLKNVPPLLDVSTMLDLLESLGATYQINQDSMYANTIELKADSIYNFTAPYEIVKKMRASILVLGPLLARFGKCKVSLPGGCAIGVRPIDLHLKGLEALGATIDLSDGYIRASAANGLKGSDFDFPTTTVTGTENVMLAATLAEGTTVLKNAALEPEIIDLANCLNKMGAKISGHGTSTIVIKGVTSLHEAEYSVMPDRIEAGTYAIAAGITRGRVDLIGGNFRKLLPSFIDKMEKAGLRFTDIENGLRVEYSGELSPISVNTEPFPGFPTDLQAQTMAMLCFVNGESNIYENIWENRFMHAAELMRMGANITVFQAHANIKGGKRLKGAPVMATDLRASISLVLAALAADGSTIIDRVYHLDRGYCCVKEKLANCGVTIDRIS